MRRPVHVESIRELKAMLGREVIHPNVVVSKIEDMTHMINSFPKAATYGFYMIAFFENLNKTLGYGKREYDLENGVMVFSAPHQVLSFDHDIFNGARGWIFLFQTELLGDHPVSRKIHKYHFFNYHANTGLCLKSSEEKMILQVFENLYDEYGQTKDDYSRNVILSNLELLLAYSERFYGRQFNNSFHPNSAMLEKFEIMLKEYFQSAELVEYGLPMVSYFANKLNVSSNHLSNLLKDITGRSAQDHIHEQLLVYAKSSLLDTEKPISTIAYELGFEYPQYFSRLFKSKTGITPKQFRLENMN